MTGPGTAYVIEMLGELVAGLREENQLLRQHVGVPNGMPASLFLQTARAREHAAATTNGSGDLEVEHVD